ncbi:hypothetical protein [Latilactobacillus sakei]|uniref:hypothetical protein n=1 Tax=Latilactobacillus sakei TaxID=1599 RepID=UPI000DC641D4|nr:hypothetical protein [Latilactobacillus sakei]SPS03688.1 hypothetical protein LAS9624_00508 [Latilactobacillus sakei]
MIQNRVKYYDNNDLSIGMFLPRMKEVIDTFLEGPVIPNDFEEVIELQNIIRYIDANLFLIEWPSEYIEQSKRLVPQLDKVIAKYLGTANEEKILNTMSTLDSIYLDDFFNDFIHFKYANRVSETNFMEEFIRLGLSIKYLLKSNYFIKNYPNSIKRYIVSDPLSIELLLSNFTDGTNEKLFFPETISKDEWDELLNRYIDEPSANLNYIAMLKTPIKEIDNTRFFSVTNRQRKRIKERYKNSWKNTSNNNSGLAVDTIIYTQREDYEKSMRNSRIEMGLKEAIERSIINDLMGTGTKPIHCTVRGLIDKDKITEDHSFKSLLRYFKDDFGFFTNKLISNFPSYPSIESGPISRSIGTKTINSYDYGFYFDVKSQLLTLKIQVILSILDKWKLNVEDFIEWFFSIHCLEEYGITWLPLNFPHKEESTANKTSILFRIEENIRKQYLLLVEEGEIDKELMIETSTPSILELQSLVSQKYASLKVTGFTTKLENLLFNDQSEIIYIDNQVNAESFFDLLSENKLSISDFREYQKEKIQYLIEENILVEENSFLRFKNPTAINLLHEIYNFGSTNYISSSYEEKKELIKLEKSDIITFSNTLFTNQEVDYLNFLLNNKIFDNSWSIRNKYQHGDPMYDAPQQYEVDHSFALLSLIMYVVKIDEELKNRINHIKLKGN